MDNKIFIKLGNKSFNLSKVDFIELDQEKLCVEIIINFDSIKFKFDSEETFNRFASYVRLFSTEFDCEVEKLSNETENNEKGLLKS